MMAFPRRTAAFALVTLLAAGQLGCRIHVRSPESAAQLHDRRWAIERVPVTRPLDLSAPPTAAAIVPLRTRPEVAAALQTPPDPYGVPTGLYALDPVLTAHRNELDLRIANAHSASNRLFVLAVVWGAIGATFFATAPAASHHAASPGLAESLFIAWGSLFAIAGIGTAAVGASVHSNVDASALQRSFEETYRAPIPSLAN